MTGACAQRMRTIPVHQSENQPESRLESFFKAQKSKVFYAEIVNRFSAVFLAVFFFLAKLRRLCRGLCVDCAQLSLPAVSH